ncbi:CobW/HypB/UreG, nucleotide-binding domain-containing protein [Blastocladiella britannica]|nr:CobW/HypB/UreG, nucleotide-binding domain-containing protein [Blastocladiella britannica]
MDTPVQVTVFTGFLGAGKSTIILDLIQRLRRTVPGYKVALLKNEFGDVEVDSLLAKESAIEVTEMLNGCLCCVLVGQMQNALQEIRDTYHPDRIIIESSGSAFPAPIAWQIRQLEPVFHLDSIATVIDVLNFRGYEDTSYTAKMQAQYTDLILLNKHELASERELDLVLDHVYELNEDTPKVKYSSDLDLDLLFGIDTRLFAAADDAVRLGAATPLGSPSTHDPDLAAGAHMQNEVDLLAVEAAADDDRTLPSRQALELFLASLDKDRVYRVKGVVQATTEDTASPWIVNHAFGRSTLIPLTHAASVLQYDGVRVRLTVMGIGLATLAQTFRDWFGPGTTVSVHEAHRHH